MSTVPKVVRYEKVGSVMTLRLSDGREFSFDAESMAKLIQEGIPEESGFNDEARQVTQDIATALALQEVRDDEARQATQDIIDEEGLQEVLDDEAREREVVEMGICEVPHIALKPNQLYRFVEMPGCEKCKKLAAMAVLGIPPADTGHTCCVHCGAKSALDANSLCKTCHDKCEVKPSAGCAHYEEMGPMRRNTADDKPLGKVMQERLLDDLKKETRATITPECKKCGAKMEYKVSIEAQLDWYECVNCGEKMLLQVEDDKAATPAPKHDDQFDAVLDAVNEYTLTLDEAPQDIIDEEEHG